MTPAESLRKKDLARIHCAKKDLGLDDDTYRAMLRDLTGKETAAVLDARQRWAVLQALDRAKGGKPAHPGKPAPQGPGKDALLSKIEAHLADAKRPWAYAHALAKRMFRRDQVQWCDADQLRRLVAALEYDQRRRNERPKGL